MDTKNIFCEVYLEGVQVEFNSIQIQETKGRPPVATVSFPADSKVMQVMPKTICHIFWRDETEDKPVMRSIFQGELVGNSVMFGFSSRQISLSFAGFTNNWYSNYVLPMDVSIPNMVKSGLMCINRPDPTQDNNAAWASKMFISDLLTPLTQLAKDLAEKKTLDKSIKTVVESFSNQGIYLRVISKAFQALDQMYVYDSTTIAGLVQAVSVSQYIAQQIHGVDGNSTVADTLQQLLNSFGYEFCELAAPVMVDGKIRRIFVKPKTDYFQPIMCNTVFDDDIATLDFQRNLDQEPTRMVNVTAPSFISDASKLLPTMIATIVPQEIFVAEAFKKEDQSLKVLGLTEEEQCRGILLSTHDDTSGVENAYYLSAANAVLKDKAKPSLDEAAEEMGKNPDAAAAWSTQLQTDSEMANASADARKFHAYQINMASLAYLDERHAQRNATVSTPYNPYRLVGFPGLILTKYFATLVGTLDSITSQISADGTANQTLTFSHIRTFNVNAGPSDKTKPPIESADTATKKQYSPTSVYAFMDDNFSDPPPWYKDFTDAIDTKYREATGALKMSLPASMGVKEGTDADKFRKAAELLKEEYRGQQLAGTTTSYILQKTKRAIPSEDDIMNTWPQTLRALRTGPIWLGMAGLESEFPPLPWILDRQKRVKEIFDYVYDKQPKVLEGHVVKVTPATGIAMPEYIVTKGVYESTAKSVVARFSGPDQLAGKAALKYKVPQEDVLALICMESSGLDSKRFTAEGGGQGAAGLMQVRQGALKDYNDRWGTHYTMDDMKTNNEIGIEIGTWYYSQRLKRWGDTGTAMAAYHKGDGAWDSPAGAEYKFRAKAYRELVKKHL